MIFVNLKTYREGTGEDALSMVSVLEEVAQANQIKVIAAAQASDIRELTQTTSLEIWAQHVDPDEFGAHTGATIAEAVKEDGAAGTFLNHSEKKFDDFNHLQSAHTHAISLGLKTLIFAGDMQELEKILDLGPTFASYEPPELVGSKETSVAAAKPEVIEKAAALAKKARIPLIVGAGIKSAQDIKISLQLGAVGVAVASSIVASDNPKASLEELAKGYL